VSPIQHPYRDGGIIANVAYEDLALGAQLLPEPGPDQPGTVTVEHETQRHGRVRVTYQLSCSAHRKSARRWFWTPFNVTKVETP
jgi:hypothetical protein